ncbi:AAA-ATPase At5g17760-like [Cajanus cajan]|uniref:AAA-ATPase At5g17760-like n=1 Tax=Cajanus cajan TaxID=3821 RepID=UPI0010FBBC51|nr:AAA-ATPase At5g17760-like [Cajanus cajan]
MFSPRDMPSPSSIFSAYASMTASIMLLRSMANELIPQPLRGYLLNAIQYLIKPRSSTLTLVIEESTGISRNQVYDAAEAYLSTRVSPDNNRLKITKTPKEKKLTLRLEKGEKVLDMFNGVPFKWRFICAESDKSASNSPNEHNSISVRSEKRSFELRFPKKHKEMALQVYLPFILDRAKEMKDDERLLKMHTLNTSYCYSGVKWDSINLEHPSTFETLAMEPQLKDAVMQDLDRFVKRREFYKRVGRAWKRGYLLYGPPGTGKSSLIAAMANYLKFDIFDLQLANIVRDSDLRKLLLATANRSILVIEDIDCTVDLPDRHHAEGRKPTDVQVLLSLISSFTFTHLINTITKYVYKFSLKYHKYVIYIYYIAYYKLSVSLFKNKMQLKITII